MIRLPNTGTYSLELITAQNGAQVVVCYSDATTAAYTGGIQTTTITSATTTTICSTPAASTVRDVDQINIKNTFAGSHTITVQLDVAATNVPIITAALAQDESLNYTHGSGWQVKDALGRDKTTYTLSSMTSAELAAIISDETGSGALVFADSPTLVTPALGTPSSGTVTNLTGTASININGTVGATTPAAGTFTTLTSTGNATLGDAEASDTHAIKGATTLLANSASAAFTVTQTGAGNAFVVEDTASTDSTPFVIDATGRVIVGYTANVVPAGVNPALQTHTTGSTQEATIGWGTISASPPTKGFYRSASGTIGTYGAVSSGFDLGKLGFFGDDGTAFIESASILCEVDGTPDTNDMPGRLVFSTTADGASSPTEAMRIDSAQRVGIGGAGAASTKVTVTGTLPSASSTSRAFSNIGTAPVTSTTEYTSYFSGPSTADGITGLTQLAHFSCTQSTITGGTRTAPTNQQGFLANNTLIGATNNYGFYSGIASGTGRWNFYAAGTANNAYAGNSSFGQVVAPIAAVDTTSLATNLVTNTAATYTVLTTDHTIIQTTAGSTYTLPAASSFTGRMLHLVTQFAGAVISASSDVVPIAGGAAGTAILAATAGKFATLQSDGTNWIIIASN